MSTAVHSGPLLERRNGSTDIVTLIAAATFVFIVVAVASDPVLAAAVGRTFGTAWSDTIGFLLRVVSR